MKRRDLLKATGLAAVADLEALAEETAHGEDMKPGTDLYREHLSRLPVPSRTPDGRYDATFARRLDDDVLADPELFATAAAHANFVSPRATVTVGFDGTHPEVSNVLGRRGYVRTEIIDGRPTYVRRGRYKQQVAVVDEETVVVGRSPELEPVTSLVLSVIDRPSDPAPLEERLPMVEAILERLGRGTVMSISVQRGATGDGGRDHAPIATGDLLSLQPPTGHLRTVAVYASRDTAKAAAAEEFGGDPNRVIRDGRALVLDNTVPLTDLEFVI